MQQTLIQLRGNADKYKSLLNNARKIIYKNYPRTPLLKNDDYSPSADPKVKTLEPKSNWFDSLLKAFFNNFSPKTPLIKNDPYEEGIDFDYSQIEVDEQNEEKSNDLVINEHNSSCSNMYDLYLDADKKMKKDGYKITPKFDIQELPLLIGDTYFSFITTDISVLKRKYSNQHKLSSAIKAILDEQLKYVPVELKQKITSLSPQDKAKFIHFFKKCLIIHEMQHYKQFITMLRVYGIDETKNIMIDRIQQQKTEYINNLYKTIVPDDVPSILNNDEKLEGIKKYLINSFNLQMNSIQKAIEGDGNKKNLELFNIILAQYNLIKNSEEQEEIQDGIKIILPNLEEVYNSVAPKNPIGEKIFHELKIVFEEIMKKHMTFQKYFEYIIQESLQQVQRLENYLNTEQYQQIYDSRKEQPTTEKERQKAEIYKEAFLNYANANVDLDGYFSNPLEIEAYTVQAQAALEKLEEYNERHKGDKK